jgi:hypothetical protein
MMAISFVVCFAISGRVLALMRDRHRETWESLGSPSLFVNNSIGNAVRLWLFNVRGGYKRLDDPQLARLVRCMNVVSLVYLACFVFLNSLVVIALLRN